MRSDLFEFRAGAHRWTRAFLSMSICLVVVSTAQSQPLLPMAPRADVRAGQPGIAGSLIGMSEEGAAVLPEMDPAQTDPAEADPSPAGATADAAHDKPQAPRANADKSSPAPDGMQRMLARRRPLAPDAPITIAFHDADLGAALQAFAEFTGLNIVAGERVRGKTSLTLTRVPWRLAKSSDSRPRPVSTISSRWRPGFSSCATSEPRTYANCSPAAGINACSPNAAMRWPIHVPTISSSPICPPR